MVLKLEDSVMRSYCYLVAFAFCSSLFTGCGFQAAKGASTPDSSPALSRGTHCVVQFRRDALGAGASTPFSPLVRQYNGTDLCLEGDLATMDADWIVLKRSDKSEIWIAKSAVLTITTAPASIR
jgi:hypothetical protein